MKLLRLLILGSVLFLCAGSAYCVQSAAVRSPNIVLIVGDDHGYPYAGFMGSQIVETPNLDRLADEGTVFTHAFASASVCRPSMQTLLTGLHPREWFAQRDRLIGETGVPIRARAEIAHYVTLPRQLARQGYQSFQGGKHWEGDFAMAGFGDGTATSLPLNLFNQVGQATFGRPSIEPMETFLDGLPPNEPFFLFVSPMLPHTPHDASAELRARYAAKGLHAAAVGYYANVTRLDDIVGEVVDALESRGLRQDSLIIYVSDNGWEQAPYEFGFLGPILGGSRGKMSIHDVGFRTPLVFNWRGRVPEGQVLSDLVTFEDLHRTILRYGGAPVPPDHVGYDLTPRIEGNHEPPARDRVFGVQDSLRIRKSEFDPSLEQASWLSRETGSFVRDHEWRYVEWVDRQEYALYRIEEDPFERNDVSADHPELVAEFAATVKPWRDSINEPTEWMDLMGRITSKLGAPAPALRVWLEREDAAQPTGAVGTEPGDVPPVWQLLTDDGGFFRIPNVPEGVYTLTWELEPAVPARSWREPAPAPATRSRRVDLTAYQTAPFLSLETPIEVEASPDGRTGASIIEVEIVSHERRRRHSEQADQSATSRVPVSIWGWTLRGVVEQRAITGPGGFLALDQLPMGFYFVRVHVDDRGRSSQRWVFLRPGDVEHFEVRLRK